ncbi:MAG: hypothetical protein FJ403_14675 [Verrucomicrobia bacterium]|nr:hypothetical protein [Verrucomicrobiota bacterium]
MPRLAYFQGQTAIITLPELSWCQPVPGVLEALTAMLPSVAATLLAVMPEATLVHPKKGKHLPDCFKRVATSELTSFIILWFGKEPVPIFRKAIWLKYGQLDGLSGACPIRDYLVNLFEQAKLRREFGGADLFFEAQ